MKIGVTSYAYRWAAGGDPRFGDEFKLEKPLSVFDLVDKVSGLGLEVLQICENVYFDMTTEDYRRLRKAAESREVTLELGAAGMELSVLKKYARIADLIGSHLLRVYPTRREPEERLVERVRGFLPVLRDGELTLAVENSSLCLYTSHQLADLFEGVNDRLFGACIDVVNSTGLLEKPLETVKVLSPYVASLHLKDFRVERKSVGGFTIYGVPLGEGALDLRAVLNTIMRSNRDPNILLEQWMEKKDDVTGTLEEEERWVKEGVRFLHSVLRDPARSR